MAVNKLIDKNLPQDQQTLLDLTQDTVTVQSLATGFTAHNSAGELIVGTYAPLKGDAGGYYTVSLKQSEDWKSVIVSFTPSADGMDEIDDFTINLPNQSAYDIWIKAGNKGDENDFLTAIKGETGPQGKSAYEVWLEQPENEGKTEAEFLTAIKGETGKQGETGEKGDRGEAGPKGDTGASAYEVWLGQPGNSGKSEQDFLDSLKASVVIDKTTVVDALGYTPANQEETPTWDSLTVDKIKAGTFAGEVKANSDAEGTLNSFQVRNIRIVPSGSFNAGDPLPAGEVVLLYE